MFPDRTREVHVATTSGKDVVNSARMQVAKQHSIDNLPYFEELFNAKAARICRACIGWATMNMNEDESSKKQEVA